MNCKDCLYENNCSLREIAKDLKGCEGHSKERPPNEGEVKCRCCKSWIKEERAFKHKDGHCLCFTCY